MAKLTPEQAQEKHARRLKASLEDMRHGAQQVTVAPGEMAAKKEDKMRAGIINAIDSGKWARKVSGVTLQEWKDAYINKGLGRVSAGIDAASDKTQAFFRQLFAYQDNLKGSLEGMPDLTLEDSIQRMVTWVRGMSEFKPE